MSATAAKLLHVASEIAGGTKALADRLGISETLLSRLMDGCRELPDMLMLRAVDIIIEERQSRVAAGMQRPENRSYGSDGTPRGEPA